MSESIGGAQRGGPRSFFDDPRMLAPRAVVREDRGDGVFVLRSPEPLQPYARCVGEWLERWARETPDAPAFAEPAPGGGWTVLGWAALRARWVRWRRPCST
ncbi:MAG UNVERIFIED_CONTAM: hypothetical protein LVR29_17145 [Microcystis novacekii LVE1205-3]|jgi:feruloyl-CoA synthase